MAKLPPKPGRDGGSIIHHHVSNTQDNDSSIQAVNAVRARVAFDIEEWS